MDKFFQTALVAVAIFFCAALSSRADMVNGIDAVVHDAVITHQEVNSLMEQTAETAMERLRGQPSVLEKELNRMRTENLERQVQNRLILHEFKDKGYTLPESLLEDMFQERMKSEFGDRARATKTLEERGMTIEKYKQLIRDRFIVQQLRMKNISQELIISPHKIEAYYLAHRENFKVEDEVKLRMIVLNKAKTDDNGRTRKLAEEIEAKLKEGASFSEMATIYSQGSQKSQGGDWGWVGKKVMRDEISSAAFALQPGQRSGIIETDSACYLMLVEDKRAEHYKSLGEVRDQIDKDLLEEERSRLEKIWIDKLKKKTFVVYF